MSGVLAVLFGIAALRGIFGLVGFIFDGIFNQYFLFIGVPGVIFMLVLRLVSLAAPIVMCLTLVLAVAKWSPAMNDLIFVGACLATVIRLLALLVNLVGSLLHVFSPVTLSSVGYFFGYVAVAGVLFLVFYLMGCAPIMGKDLDGVKASVSKGFSVLSSAAEKFKSEHPPKTAQNQTNGTASPNPSYATAGTQGRPAYAGQAKKTSRGLIKYILLSFITCGIYPLVLVHMLSSDMNEICEGDGNKTGGLLAFLLLGMITCGIYQFVWWYKLCNRMAANAPRYGITFQENGTTYLMWSLFGMLLCGIGPFIALHFVLRNSNAICNAYNQQNGLSGFAN